MLYFPLQEQISPDGTSFVGYAWDNKRGAYYSGAIFGGRAPHHQAVHQRPEKLGTATLGVALGSGVCRVRRITCTSVFVLAEGALVELDRNSNLRLQWSLSGIGLESNECITLGHDVMPSKTSRERKGRAQFNIFRKDGTPVRRHLFADPIVEAVKTVKHIHENFATAQVMLDRLRGHSDSVVANFAKRLVVQTHCPEGNLINGGKGRIFDLDCKCTFPNELNPWKAHLKRDIHSRKVAETGNRKKGLNMFQMKRHQNLKEKGEAGGTITAGDVGLRYDIERGALKGRLSDQQVQVLRGAIERVASCGEKLGATADMASLIPLILEQEVELLKKTMGDNLVVFADAVCMVMDATTLAKEDKTCVLVRVMDRDLYLQQRLVGITATAHHASGKNDARLAASALARLGLSVEELVAFAADRHAGNGVCHEEFRKVNAAILLIGCFSHTLDKVGKNFDAPELKRFMENVRSLLCLSNYAKQLFREEDDNGKDLAGYAAIRWWNDWVQQVQILAMGSLDAIERVATKVLDNKLCEASSKRLLKMLGDPVTRAKVWVQMTASVEAGRPFASAGFNMEGDSAGLPFLVAGQLKKLADIFVDFPMPELRAASYTAAKLVEGVNRLEEVSRLEVVTLQDEVIRLEEAITRAAARQKKHRPSAPQANKRRLSHHAQAQVDKKAADAAKGLMKANTDFETLTGQLHDARAAVEGATATAQSAGLRTPGDWYAFGVAAVAPGLKYYRDRFMDLDRVAAGHGQKAVNSGLLATKAYLAAELFHPTVLAKLASEDNGTEKVMILLQQLLHFPFVTKEDLDALLREAPAFIRHAIANPTLPAVVVRDEVIMQKGSVGKKVAALKRIKRRRHADAVRACNECETDDDDDAASPWGGVPNTLPPSLEGLREEVPRINAVAYGVMEYWRRDVDASSGLARFEAFPAWGKLLRKIALCCPSSAAAERVFSLLKLVLGDLEWRKFAGKVEATMLLMYNDIDV